ncbi:MAG: hypothetical protein ACYTFO_04445 [Planctomycetota bacterium]|jgi:hypothetical protein
MTQIPMMTAGSGAAAAQAAIANAIKASGAIVHVEPDDFLTFLAKTERPLVVTAEGGIFTKYYLYLTSYKGMFFYAKAKIPLSLPADTERINAKKIWIPG